MTQFDPRIPTHIKQVSLTPADGVFIEPTKGLYMGATTARNLTVVDGDGNIVVYGNMQPGTYLPICITALASTGTTALAFEVVALY